MKKYKITLFFQEILTLFLFCFSIEILFRVLIGFQLFDWATLRILCSTLLLVIFFEFLMSFFKKPKTREILGSIFLFIVTIYSLAQLGFQNFLGMFISVGTSNQLSAVSSYVLQFLGSFKIEYYLLFLPFLFYVILLFLKKKERREKIFIEERIILVGLIIMLCGGYWWTIEVDFMQNPLQLVENKTLFLNPSNASVAINQFGTTVYGLLDVKQVYFPSKLETHTTEKEEEKDFEILQKHDDTVWNEVIKEENDFYYNVLNRYFINRPSTYTNEYTGMFKEKNVIVIMMESVNNAILNADYFPNFQKLLQHGWYWENNYSPRNACATGDNEFSGMTSLYPVNTSCTVNIYPENTYFNGIFNRFNDAGYITSSYHDLDSTYYVRDIFHENMGSMNYYDANRLGMNFDSSNYLEWPSDVEFIELASQYFMNDMPFMTWMTTVTAHQPYDTASIYGNYYYDLFQDTDYPDTVKRYLSKVKITDDALGRLLELLEENGILEDTVIVLYGDHYPYGLSNEDVKTFVDYDIDDFYEIERTPLLIYNSEIEPQVFKEKTFYMNILPTLMNLFDLEYDSRFYLGEDMLSGSFSGRVIFADGSWEDDVARYNAMTGEITYFSEEKKYTIDEIRTINYDIYKKKEMSKLAITKNYFEYLKEKLEEKKVLLEGEENE